MQYILTEEEYKQLATNQGKEILIANLKIDDLIEKLQIVCTLAANHIFINGEPWVCIQSVNDEDHHCGGCPVEKDCPYDKKKFWESCE